VLYVPDNKVKTGAAFAVFSAALRERWPAVRLVMRALLFRRGKASESTAALRLEKVYTFGCYFM
jgi:hypothetical protein